MRVRIHHVTTYAYDRPVFVEPTVVRLTPRSDMAQRVEATSIAFEPEPAGRTLIEDPEGNLATHAWFEGLTDHLRIVADHTVETLRSNPFDFIVLDPALMRVPCTYPPSTAATLARFMDGGSATSTLAREVLATSGPDVLAFCDALTKRLHADIEQEIRHVGPPRAPGETLAMRRGSCRDTALVFMDACRGMGLAARFASGYQLAEEVDGERYMHAWPEVYVAGAGWRGFDPVLGLAVADAHVSLAVAHDHAGAIPTSGAFRGTDATAEMSTAIEITPA